MATGIVTCRKAPRERGSTWIVHHQLVAVDGKGRTSNYKSEQAEMGTGHNGSVKD